MNALSKVQYQFEFSGKAGEYFRIWVVNILLTIATFGIYSAWAKVRSTRYIYGNTRLNNAAFDYLANPVTILKGRVIAVIVFAIYSVATYFYPMAIIPFGILFLIALPWLIVSSLSFSLRNTNYRNIRFDFKGTYGEAILVFILLILLIPVTFGLILPYLAYRTNKLVLDNISFGNMLFKFEANIGKFYFVYGVAILILLIPIALIGITIELSSVARKFFTAYESLLPFIAGPVYLFIWVYIDTKIKNLVWCHTLIEDNRLHSELAIGKMLWLNISNLLAIIISAGLLIPWAKIRMIRYRLECMNIVTQSDMNNVTTKHVMHTSATGEGMSDIFDVDLGL